MTEPVDLPLSAYERYYQRAGLAAYAAVFELTDEKDIEAQLCAERLAGFTAKRDRIRVLDIGCGLGAFTCRFLQKLASPCADDAPPQFVCDLVDINAAAFSKFREAAASMTDCDIHVKREVEGAWQHVGADFPEAAYDLVVANHVFYGCRCDEQLVSSLQRLLAPGGVALVALVGAQSDLIHLRSEAGIPNNTADDFGKVLVGMFGNYSRFLYDSKFRFRRDDPRHIDWFFASGSLDAAAAHAILDRHARTDGVSEYIANRAAVFLLEEGVDDVGGTQEESPGDL